MVSKLRYSRAKLRVFSVLLLVLFFSNSLTVYSSIPEPVTPTKNPLDKLESTLLNKTGIESPLDLLVKYNAEANEFKARSAIELLDNQADIVEIYEDLSMMRVKILGTSLIDLAKNLLIERIWSNEIRTIHQSTSLLSDNPENYQPLIDLINARSLWNQGYNGTGIVIAILDTGIDFTHPDLDDFDDDGNTTDTKVTTFASFVEADALPIDIIGHGTYAASIAAGTGNKSDGLYAGIAPGATLLGGKVTLGGLFASPSWIVSGIEWAARSGADIICLPFNTLGAPNDAVSIAIDEIVEKGIFVVAASGDDGPDYLTVMSPGGGPSCFTVGAYDTTRNEVPAFSGRGPSLSFVTKPDLVAPGVGIVGAKYGASLGSLLGGDGFSIGDLGDLGGVGGLLGEPLGEDVDDNYIIADTTSASAAIVAGAVAILMQAFNRATPIVLGNVLRDTATIIPYGANDAGAGLLNLEAAFDYLSIRQKPGDATNRTTGTPLLAIGLLTSSAQDASTSLLMSSFGTSVLALDQRGEDTGIHLLMGMFSLRWNDNDPMNLMQFDVKREMHQVVVASDFNNYNRWIGVLSYEDQIYVTLLVESYNLTLTTNQPITGYRITPFVLNLGQNAIANVSLFCSYSLDLFLDGENDHGKYAIENQQLFAYSISEDYNSFYFGMNSSIPLSGFEVGNSSEISSHIADDALNGSTTFDGSVGLGMKWDFGVLETNIPSNVTIAMGFGENRTLLDESITTMWELDVPATFVNRGDLIVVEADLPRVARVGRSYSSRAVVMNIGEENSTVTAAMIVGKGEETEGTLFANYFQYDVLQPFQAEVMVAEWSPELEDVYSAAWLVSTGIGDALDLFANPTTNLLTTGLTILDDFVIRDLFVVTPIESTSVFPKVLPFAPFDIHFPADFGLYTFVVSTTVELGNLTVKKYGNATDWGNVSLNDAESITSYYNFSLFLLAPPITMDGYHRCDYVISTEFGWTTNITLERELQYPRAMYLLDTSHGGGFDIGGDVDLGGDLGGDMNFSLPLAQDSEEDDDSGFSMDVGIGDLDDLGSLDDFMESFRLTTFSGLSELKKTMRMAGLDLVETPGMELDPDLLQQFAGVMIFSPTELFNASDVEILSNFTRDGGKLILFGDNDDRANLTAINSLLFEFGYEMKGEHDKDNTTEIATQSMLGAGIECLYLNGGSYILNNESNVIASINGRPVALMDSTTPELVLFGSSRIFMNKYLVECNNSILLDNLNDYLLRNTLTAQASLAENRTRYPVGQSVYLNLEISDYWGEPVNDLFVAIVFELPDGEMKFFIAGFVQDGLYSSQFTPSYYNDEGRINGIFIIIDEDYAATYASTSFELYQEADTTPDGNGTLFNMVFIAVITSVGVFGALFAGLFLNKYRRGKRYRIPELDTRLMNDIDTSLNTLLAIFIQMQEIIQRKDIDRIQKVELIRGLMVSLREGLQEFSDVSDTVGGV
ncbi:MAG: S8 family serine peptidase [Candidatus Lokiarchaeota archaeon]|nr:S8 family serine peptidase [Candidatus Lokiarchaeota archaeon]